VSVASFFVSLGTGEEKILSSEKPLLLVGRLPESEIFIDEPVVSRRHAEIFIAEGKHFVRDAGSRNGTFLNGKRVFQPAQLAPGSVITIGGSRIVFEPSSSPSFLKERVQDKPSSTVNLSRPEPTAGLMAPLVLLQTVAAIAQELVQARSLESLLDSILRSCVEKTGSERAAIMLLDPGGIPVPRAYYSKVRSAGKFAVSMSIITKAIAENQAILIRDVAGDERLRLSESIANLRIRSAICTPLWNGEKTIGVLYVDTSSERQLTETDLHFFSSLSGMIAGKIENTVLAEIAEEKHRLDTEIEIARNIQSNLLPKSAPAIPGHQVAYFNRPSREVGGDYFDVVAIGDARGIAIADVAGKSIGAALLMSNLQALLRSTAPQLDSPGEVLGRMNADLAERVGEGRFVTAVYLVLRPETGRAAYANAGHNPPFLVTASGETSQLEVSGLPLGILPESQYATFEVALGPGDVLALYSDGVTDAVNPAGERFEEERLAAVLRESSAGTASEILDAVLLEVDTFREEAALPDDLTLVVLKRTGPATGPAAARS
jgi:serine phosphatase RsbU (regulator of sigma subunit)/pSer/pThr/pTyr-binding forkhead associated (FHA) protein